MKKFSLSLLVLMSSITCFAEESTFENESFEIASPGSTPIEVNPIVIQNTVSFKKYMSFDLSSLAKLHARVNFGLRKEIGQNGYDLGLFGTSGRDISGGGAYATFLYYFNPDSNFKVYSGAGMDAGLLWAKLTYGALARCMIPIGLNHIAKSGRNEFFQLNLFWPVASYEIIYKRHRTSYYFLSDDLVKGRPYKYQYENIDERQPSYKSRTDFKKLGVSFNYGLFF